LLVERFRDRGLGDLLFLTGPFAFMHHVSGGEVKIHTYAFSDRSAVLYNNPQLEHRTAFVGPTHYDDFPQYDYQWMIESVTESCAESDQLNVYDALYQLMGLNPAQIDPKFKRPHVYPTEEELGAVNQFHYHVWMEKRCDLRKTGYYVVAPLTHSKLRATSYRFWLDLCVELAKRRPVIVVGQPHENLPVMDMAPGAFIDTINELGDAVLNAIQMNPPLPLRSVMALIARANCVVTLDTGPLYIAQGVRTPAISLWGPHDPGVRLGYDQDYMELAIWNESACGKCPCFCYGSLPYNKCPHGTEQDLCEVLKTVTVDAVLEKMDLVDRRDRSNLGTFAVKL
jgi:hypothetical protein